tara:strand:+ start:51 stop:425 length:375 start_codon:yes stop_codon:yes gene_type:complete
MSAQTLLSGGDKWFSYSGVLQGGVTLPASIQMILIPNTGLRDSLVQIMPFFGQPISSGGTEALGLEIKLNDVSIYNMQRFDPNDYKGDFTQLFVPRQSKLEIISLNTDDNNSQNRGCNIIGYYL